MEDLIKRLEEATEGSASLDLDIAILLGLKKPVYSIDDKYAEYAATALPYTTSLDAALQLVPEWWEWQVSNRAPKSHAGRAYIHNKESHFVGMGASPNPALKQFEVTAATPALALCIAALKARATTA